MGGPKAGKKQRAGSASWQILRLRRRAGGRMMQGMKKLLIAMLMAACPLVQAWQPVNVNAPEPAREFRAAWVATVFNLDWPSRSGLAASAQQAELMSIIRQAHKLKLNAIILQVRPTADALYSSGKEPWSTWLSGAGVNPGYDPLALAVQEAHKRGIEVHAWFNPFRANVSGKPVGRGHVSQKLSGHILKAGSTTMLNPSSSAAQSHVMDVILDVVRRYDIDGVHLDDYFYPYPPNNNVADGKTPAQRRAAIDSFVSTLYRKVKSAKPHVRVGISPFGIWQPGYPAGVQAGVNAYEHLACDARKWLANGWVDYLAPQLYWPCEGPQSFPALMQWWAAQNPGRPVWPGIATARIGGKEFGGRGAGEIANQVTFSRKYARQSSGQLFWSWKSLASNKGGIQGQLQKLYTTVAVPPAMPWSGSSAPARPAVQAVDTAQGCSVSWSGASNVRKWVVQVAHGGQWWTMYVLPGAQTRLVIPANVARSCDYIAVRPLSGTGVSGTPGVLKR